MRTIADKKVKAPLYGSESLDSLPLPVILISSDCILLAANKKAQEVFPGFVAGGHISEMIADSYFLETCGRVFEKGEAMECEIIRTIRRKRTFQASISPFQNEEGNGAYVAIYETTAASEAERMRASFVADVSHELRSPLTTLIATIETLRGRAGANPDTRARFIELMAQETDRMHGIVDDLLSLSATEAVEHILPNQQANLFPILSNIAKVLSTKARAKSMDIILEADDNLPDMRGDYDELYQAIYNLVENAVKYGESDSNVTLRVDVVENNLEVRVHNYGTVIQEKHIPRLTERFYRVDKSRSRDLGGTGLGLAIVKHTVNRHLGEMVITSSEDEGTTFAVVFPVASAEVKTA